MAIAQRILDLDDLFETAMKNLPGNARHPKHLLSNLKIMMNKHNDLGMNFNTDDVRQAFDRWLYKNRHINSPVVVMNLDEGNKIVKPPKVGTNFVNDAGEVYIFEKTYVDEFGQNNFQFRSPTGTIENVLGNKLPNTFQQIDNKYDLDDVKAYHDDMYELYVHKQQYEKLNVNDRDDYYKNNIEPLLEKIENRSASYVERDSKGQNTINWAREIKTDVEKRTPKNNTQQTQQRSININDPGSWTDDDIRTMAEGDPEAAQEFIKQREAARNQSSQQQGQQINQEQINHDIPDNPEQTVDIHSQSPEETVDMHNSNAPDPNQTINNIEQNIEKNNSDWRQKVKDQQRSQRGVNVINVDETNAKVNINTPDAYNIYKTVEDANGNTRTQHWKRKSEWSGETDLISDVSWNQYGSYDNMTGKYTGQDRSPIDWINADEWDDDYILGRAGDDEDLLNSMMNARERKIQENEKRNQSRSETSVDTPSSDDPIPDNAPNIDTRPQVDPDNPLTWTEEYMDEISEGDPAYYDELNRRKLDAEKAERLKNIDPNNPTTWTNEYINETARNQDEINEMTKQMRDAKNLDTVDKINQQRRNQREPNRQERRQQQKDNRQKGNYQKKKTKKQKEKEKRNKKFNDRHTAQGNNPDEQRRINRQYNEERRRKQQQQQQQQQQSSKLFDENDPTTWTEQDMADMADGDPDLYKELKQRKFDAENGNPHGPSNKLPDEFEFGDAPEANLPEIDAPDTEIIDDLINNADDIGDSMKGLGKKLSTFEMFQSGINILGAVGDYKAARRKGHGVVSSAIRAGAQFAIGEALGLWAIPVELLKHTPGAIIKGADMLYKENRRMNSAANNQIFGDAQFMDTQQLATMRQSGMEMAKMAQYNLQQTLMGNEAQYLHR